MKSLFFFVAILGLAAALPAHAWETKVLHAQNYSKVIVCQAPPCSFGAIKLQESFEAYLLGDPIPTLAGGTLKEKFQNMVTTRIGQFSQPMADSFNNSYDSLLASIHFLSGIRLDLVKESDYVALPIDGALEQLAVMITSDLNEQVRIVNNDLWIQLSDEEKVGVLFHMMVTDKVGNYRDFSRQVLTDKLKFMLIHNLAELFKYLGFSRNLFFAGVHVNYEYGSFSILDNTLSTNMGNILVKDGTITFENYSYKFIYSNSRQTFTVQGKPLISGGGAIFFYHSKEICAFYFDGPQAILKGSDGADYIIDAKSGYAFSKSGQLVIVDGQPVRSTRNYPNAERYCDRHYYD